MFVLDLEELVGFLLMGNGYLKAEGSGGWVDGWGVEGEVGSTSMKLVNSQNTVPGGRGMGDQAGMVEENFTLINFD